MSRGAFKSSLLLMGTLGMAQKPKDLVPMPTAMSLRSPADLEGIIRVVQRWAKAWQEGDMQAMFACLHPDLARRVLDLENPSSAEALQRVAGVPSVLGNESRSPHARTQVCVLDVQGPRGSARVELGPWTAFMQLTAHGNGWVIANVTWE